MVLLIMSLLGKILMTTNKGTDNSDTHYN